MTSNTKLSKNQRRRLKKKEEKSITQKVNNNDENKLVNEVDDVDGGYNDVDDVIIEYVSANLADSAFVHPLAEEFKAIFDKFATPEELTSNSENTETTLTEGGEKNEKELIENDSSAVVDEPKKISKKKRKLMSRLSVAELKQLVQRPDVVEAHDVTTSDPRLLVYLKAYRNTVPVPRHWCHKRKYLQGKRGIEKTPFELPEFIAETGIAKIRESVIEQESLKKSKQKARDKLQPKMGKIDIDYQVLHDAFFKYQRKPKLSHHGDLYYEGKEFEVNLKEKKPGLLSPELIAALGMSENSPPPWLINMQRYGPPPSYPFLKIPGLSAPLPPGASFGYHPGGWGKAPVDEYGRPLYGDVFGSSVGDESLPSEADKVHWGEVTEQEAEESEESEEEEEREDDSRYRRSDASGSETPFTTDGMSSIATGLETPETVDLRKKREGLETPDSSFGTPRELYRVIQEKHTNIGGQLFGSDKTYMMPGKGDVQVSINPDKLVDELQDMSEQDHLKDAYDSHQSREDYDDDRDDARGKRKRRADAGALSKRNKGFKF